MLNIISSSIMYSKWNHDPGNRNQSPSYTWCCSKWRKVESKIPWEYDTLILLFYLYNIFSLFLTSVPTNSGESQQKSKTFHFVNVALQIIVGWGGGGEGLYYEKSKKTLCPYRKSLKIAVLLTSILFISWWFITQIDWVNKLQNWSN